MTAPIKALAELAAEQGPGVKVDAEACGVCGGGTVESPGVMGRVGHTAWCGRTRHVLAAIDRGHYEHRVDTSRVGLGLEPRYRERDEYTESFPT